VHAFAREHWRALPTHARAMYRRHAPSARLPEVTSLANEPRTEPQLESDLARAVAAHRGQVERDFEATRVDDDLDEARRDLALSAAERALLGDPSSNAHYLASCRLNATWLAYRATRDPRFKALLAAHERLFAR
jgi:hypothetical protein